MIPGITAQALLPGSVPLPPAGSVGAAHGIGAASAAAQSSSGIGAASGTGGAAAVSASSAVGSAIGTGAASAVGASTFSAPGSAAGVGAASGVSPGTPPTYVNAGTLLQNTGSTIVPALPASRTNGNLLVAYASTNTSTTMSVSAGWTAFITVNNAAGRSFCFAYRYVTGSETAPTFTPGTTANMSAQVLQYTGVVASSPIGGSNSSNGTATSSLTCGSYSTTQTSSLAVNVAITNSTTSTPAAPSGYTVEEQTSTGTGAQTTAADLGVPAIGTVSSTSVSFTASNWLVASFEIKSH